MLWFNVKPTTFRLVHFVFIAVSLYLFCGLLRYFVLKYFKKKQCIEPCNKKSNKAPSSVAKSASVKRSNSRKSVMRQTSRGMQHRHKKFVKFASTVMMVTSLIAGMVTFVHNLLDLWVFSVNNRFSLHMLCVRQKWSGVMLFLGVFCVYLFLWTRQRIFYSHPVLRNLSKPVLNRFSWSVLFVIIFSITTFTISYYAIPSDLQVDSDKLSDIEYFVFYNDSTWKVFAFRHDNENAESSNSTTKHHTCTFKSKSLFLLSHLVITVMFLYFQISLQLLFAYPVMKSRRKRKRLMQQYEQKDKINKQESNFILKPKSSEEELLNAESTSSSSVANSYRFVSSKNICKRVSVSQSSLKNDASRSELRQAFSESSLKTMSLKLQRVNNNNEGFEKLEKHSTFPKSCSNLANNRNKQQTLSIASSSDSKLTSTQRSSGNKICFSNVSCASIQKHRCSKKSKMSRYIWRCFFVSLVCCFTDVATFGFNVYTQISSSYLYANNLPNALRENALRFNEPHLNTTKLLVDQFEERVTISLLSVIAYNGNMIVNLICMILCYDNFMEMLLPCFLTSNSKQKSASQQDSS